MKATYHNIWVIATAFIAAMSLTSCIYDYEADPAESDNIRINAMTVGGSRAASEAQDEGFAVLFWMEDDMTGLKDPDREFPLPYLYKEAHQPVDFYSRTVYDTGYPYPSPETTMLYATGYAPASALQSDDNFRTLTVADDDPKKGRHDLLGCDLWPEVYKGSLNDPFAMDKNKLFFRHLAAKLVFYADRDKKTMENKQYVRNVQVSKLYMSTDGGKNWTAMHTPSQFRWSRLEPGDFTTSYKKTIAAVKTTEGNEGVSANPECGYLVSASHPFGDDENFVLSRNASDRVPVSGTHIDSCYVCNPVEKGTVTVGTPIRLKMDISAEMSFKPDFPKADSGDDPSTTDDLTFTRTWKDVPLDAIYQVNEKGEAVMENGKKTEVKEFKAGNEYHIYIHFYRTGVNLTAIEMPWNPGGVHYITISGGDKQSASEDEQNKQ